MVSLHEKKFFETLFEFIDNLKLTFPESVPRFDTLVKAVSARQDSKTVKLVWDRLRPHGEAIKSSDVALFIEPAVLLPGIDFQLLWAKNISSASRKAIWQYLQLLHFMGTMICEKPTEDVTEEMTKALKPAANEPKTEGGEEKNSGVVESLAEELIEEMNIKPENFENPQDMMKSLFTENGGIGDLIGKVTGKVKTRIDSGQLNERVLLDETRGIFSKLNTLASEQGVQIPDMSKMMQGMMSGGGANMGDMMKSMMESMGKSGGGAQNGAPDIMKMVSSLMGGSEEESELMDLDELQRKVKKEMRKEYQAERDRNGKRDQLKQRLEARKSSQAKKD